MKKCQIIANETVPLLNWFLRLVLGVKQGTCIPMLLGESGVYPPSVLCHINVILYYIRLNNLPHGSVLKSVFLDVQNQRNYCYSNNWCSNAISLAHQYGLDIENFQFNLETKKYVKRVIKDKFVNDWHDKLNSRPGLRFYKLFKHEFRCEPYLQNIKNKNCRKMFTRLRTNSHHLEIERGRYSNKNEIDRCCFECDVIENEFHFVMICPLYSDLRVDLFNEIIVLFPFICQYSVYEQFIFLMGFDDPKLHNIVSKFISNAFNVRSGVALTLPAADGMCQSSDAGGCQSHT